LIKELKNQQQNFELEILARKKYKTLEERLKTAKER